MEIDDTYVKELISTYQETGEGFSKILEHLSMFIYYFPRLVTRRCEEDVFGEYYNYFLERFPKILLSYTPWENVLFKTWFYLVQRRHYLNFLKSRRYNTFEKKCEFIESFSLDILEVSVPPTIVRSELLKKLSSIITEDDILFLKLFSPENLTRVDFEKLMNLLQCDLQTLNQRIRILFDYVEVEDKKNFIRLIPVNRVALFLGWNRLKVSKKLSKIRETIKKNYIWEE